VFDGALIRSATRSGTADPDRAADCASIPDRVDADHVGLASTELPPVAANARRLVDVTAAVAEHHLLGELDAGGVR
jgi:hypothetical protein